MPFEYPLWLGPATGQDQGPPFGAQQYRQLVDLLFAEGVLDVQGGQLAVTATTGLTLNVAAGAYVVKGDDVIGQGSFYGRNLAPGTTVTLAAAPATNSRIDLIVVKVNDAESTGQTTNNAAPTVITGVTAATPAVPALPGSAIPLAQVLVAAGTSTITSANITDLRTQSGGASLKIGTTAVPLTTTQRLALTGTQLVVGLLVFDTTVGKLYSYGGSLLGWVAGLLDVQVFAASGTWTKPAGAALVIAVCFGSGGGGARRNSQAYGLGGSGGERADVTLAASAVGATESVTVGAGGTGETTAGAAPVDGGRSSFGQHLVALGGSKGVSGNFQLAGGGGYYVSNFGYIEAPNAGGGSDGNGGRGSLRGGGAGGCFDGTVGRAGGASGVAGRNVYSTGGAAGVSTTPAGAGTSRSGTGRGGDGGGGGAGQVGSTGGAGGIPGGGGGGTETSNNAGSGARGEVIVYTLCI